MRSDEGAVPPAAEERGSRSDLRPSWRELLRVRTA